MVLHAVCGLVLSDRVRDARTIWLFREKLTRAGVIESLFDRFDAALRTSGYIALSGQIVDASLIAAPQQRNTDDERKALKAGSVPEDWKTMPAKLRPKERDDRWSSDERHVGQEGVSTCRYRWWLDILKKNNEE